MTESDSHPARRETFSSRFGLLMTMIGVAVGLGNVWRFPYMAGEFGGAPFVLFYVLMAAFVGVPALMAEWTLGRATGHGPVGAFETAGAPAGRFIGWAFFAVVIAAVGYYSNAIGWVLFYALSSIIRGFGLSFDASIILPPDTGFAWTSILLQLLMTGTVIGACALVLVRGLRKGIERASRIIIPALVVILIILIIRGVTLPGADAGLSWYLFKFEPGALTPGVMLAALGQAVFSLSLGGTYMVVYGSYLGPHENIRQSAMLTAAGDVIAGLLAGFAIFPAVFALGLEPSSGPGLLFSTLPTVFSHIPVGWIFGLLFFVALFGAAYLSDVAAIEVLVAGLTDKAGMSRRKAVLLTSGLVFLASIPPMINMEVFVPWDLTFGSGMQTLGALLAVLTVGWSLSRAKVIEELSTGTEKPISPLLYFWVKYVIPAAILIIGIWWILTDVLHVVSTA